MHKTPNTRRKIKEEKLKDKVQKLGCFPTFMTLIKGFICTGCLYLPKSVINGGWLFSSIMLGFSCVLTIYCAMLLLDIRKKLNLTSYTEIGMKTYGKWAKIAVDIALWGSQSGFCCAYVFFIKENFSQIFSEAFDWDVDPNYIAATSFVVFTLLCFVRKIEKFAITHLFADTMIVLTLVVVVVFGVKNIKAEGSQLQTISKFNTASWYDAIGFSVYSFEGIGVILPVLL